jgi:hypothetical protein
MNTPVLTPQKDVKLTSDALNEFKQEVEKTYGWALDFMRKYEKRREKFSRDIYEV